MKKLITKFGCAILAIAMLAAMLPVSAGFEDYTDATGHWAEATLRRAVEDGYLVGSGDKLTPEGGIDTAQAATIINRVLKAQNKADLTGKTDMPENAWYREDIEKAVSLGYIDVNTDSAIRKPLTRAQVFVIFAKAFQLMRAQPDYSVLTAFSDAGSLAGESKNAAASLAGQGLVSGSGGKLRPGSGVTRAEFITMLYRIADAFELWGCAGGSGQLKEGGSTIIRGGSVPYLYGSGNYGTVVLAQREGDVSLAPTCAKCVIVGAGSGRVSLSGKIDAVDITGVDRTVSVSGTVGKLTVSGGNVNLSLEYGSTIGEVVLMAGAEKCRLTINGTVEKLTVLSSGCEITGSGRVNAADIQAPDCKAAVSPYGSAGLQIELTAPEKLGVGQKLTVAAGFKNAAELSDCTLQWYVDGKPGENGFTDNFTVKSDSQVEYSPKVSYKKDMAASMTVGLSLRRCVDGQLLCVYGSAETALENYPAEHYKAEETARVNALVTTYQYPSTVRYNTTLYKQSSLSGAIRNLKSGTAATCIYRIGFTAAQIRLADGTSGWVPYDSLRWSGENYTRNEDYSAADKELWINGRGYTSSTDYLVWVSLACQKVNVFSRTGEGWKLVKAYPCASGASSTPTPLGVFKISYHQTRWAYNTYWCGPITGFYGNYAFHSWLNRYDGSAYDHTMGRPASHGCIRMPDEGARYMYTLPMNSTVVVY